MSRVMNQIGDFGAPDNVLAGKAIDIRARSADPSPFDDDVLLLGFAKMPGQALAGLAASDDEIFDGLRAHVQVTSDDSSW